jgi:thiol-disulfide isomerase/thioredoxin
LVFLSLAQCRPSPRSISKFTLRPTSAKGGTWLDEGAPVPHHIADYRGKVVLIDFWEYTCINCIRDFGVVKRWYTKYHPMVLR